MFFSYKSHGNGKREFHISSWQAQVVLQGKSRQTIIRELQKTSLDVNLAVNNLLSRDDDDPDDGDEDSYMQESYFPGGMCEFIKDLFVGFVEPSSSV